MKTNIKKIGLALMLLTATQLANAQMGGMGGGMGGGRGGMRGEMGGGGSGREEMNIDFTEAAGLIYFDIEEVTKATKVKDETTVEKINQSIFIYEDSLLRIGFAKPTELQLLQEATSVFEQKNMDLMKEMMPKIQDAIREIQPLTRIYQEQLKTAMDTLLSEKELKRWNKYFEKKMGAMPKKRGEKRPDKSE